MTTNKPEVVAYLHSDKENQEHRGVSLHHDASCTSTFISTEPLIRLSEYEALQAECEELGKDLAETELRALKFIHQCNAHVELYQELRCERDQLQTECEKLRKDAERYRWLRDKSESLHSFYLSTPVWMTGVRFRPENVDSTIDAAMQGDQP